MRICQILINILLLFNCNHVDAPKKSILQLNYKRYYSILYFTDIRWHHFTEAGGGTGPFSIDQSTAAIRLSSSLDYETKTSYAITVVATDGGGSQVETVLTKTFQYVGL